MERLGIAPLTQLALGMEASPGLYAVLLGSGISSAAGIPTGYQITERLIERIARAEGASPAEPFEWYKQQTGVAARYSNLLERLAKTPSERKNLLHGFFEPTPEERERGVKLPSKAHHRLADLIARGLVRIVITTNFDRLLEHALNDRGVEPVVLASDDAIAGAEPLSRAGVVVIKVNGDYLDSRIRNTTGELAAYPQATADRLVEVFNDFGLVICGWSGKWDSALRAALEKASGRRYSTFWFLRHEPESITKELITLRAAITVTISDADHAFAELDEKCRALERAATLDLVTPQLAAASAKRWLQRWETHRIDIDDLLMTGIDRVVSEVASGSLRLDKPSPTEEPLNERIKRMVALMETTLNVAVVLAGWGGAAATSLLGRALERLVSNSQTRGASRRYELWNEVALYPAALLWHTAAIAAFFMDNATVLKGLFSLELPYGKTAISALDRLHVWSVLCNRRKMLSGYENYYCGESYHLADILRDIFRRELHIDDVRGVVFRFDYFLVLVSSLEEGIVREQAFANEGVLWPTIAHEMLRNIEAQGDDWVGVRAEFFEDAGDATKAIRSLEEALTRAEQGGLHRNYEDELWQP